MKFLLLISSLALVEAHLGAHNHAQLEARDMGVFGTLTVTVTVTPTPSPSPVVITNTVYITVTAAAPSTNSDTSMTLIPTTTTTVTVSPLPSSFTPPIPLLPPGVSTSPTSGVFGPSTGTPTALLNTTHVVSPLINTCPSPITCSKSTACSADKTCLCQPSVDGVGYCLADVACSVLQNCNTNTDCDSGAVCMITCCSTYKCLTIPFLCKNPGAPSALFAIKEIGVEETTNEVGFKHGTKKREFDGGGEEAQEVD